MVFHVRSTSRCSAGKAVVVDCKVRLAVHHIHRPGSHADLVLCSKGRHKSVQGFHLADHTYQPRWPCVGFLRRKGLDGVGKVARSRGGRADGLGPLRDARDRCHRPYDRVSHGRYHDRRGNAEDLRPGVRRPNLGDRGGCHFQLLCRDRRESHRSAHGLRVLRRGRINRHAHWNRSRCCHTRNHNRLSRNHPSRSSW